ncbi:hypothetical protein LGH83_10860 [Lichenihabitans sp. PAMC28606]|uniref:hypothetical protein n=1 Tax=Lichenihabitans sp. PAMC28606 TaxID=2880932 RepID=UPI001D0B9BE7|nr:hypothetical protein [Lichenihabitans sp. PAMC28606]UDL93127.1 hypothetical protein LGH83_10860 [Lichenihabitans sp. PAMC28606]
MCKDGFGALPEPEQHLLKSLHLDRAERLPLQELQHRRCPDNGAQHPRGDHDLSHLLDQLRSGGLPVQDRSRHL